MFIIRHVAVVVTTDMTGPQPSWRVKDVLIFIRDMLIQRSVNHLDYTKTISLYSVPDRIKL